MGNPLFNQFGGNIPQNPFAQLIAQAQELKKTLSNPQAEVQKLLDSGQMTQQQFNQLSQQAQQLVQSFNLK